MKGKGISPDRQVQIVDSLLSNDYVFPICQRIQEKLKTMYISEDLVNIAIADVTGSINETNQRLFAILPKLKKLSIGDKRKKDSLAYSGLFSPPLTEIEKDLKHAAPAVIRPGSA